MNKKNFARVVRRIAKSNKWDQTRSPCPGDIECGAPYCFAGHAEFIRSKGKRVEARSVYGFFDSRHPLTKWLGLNGREMIQVYSPCTTLAIFRHWLKKGKVL